jgi:MFS transporter, DHA2 family, multidrug resistance protein
MSATPQAAGGPPTQPPPLYGSARVVATVALSLATFMNVLDTTIANVSIPAIAGDLGVSPNQGTWVITSFAVANAIAVPLTGWLAQRFGQVRLFVTSVLLFVVASILCGLAPSIELLVAARVLQGAVAGPMIPLSQSLLLQCYPKEKSSMALAAWSMTTLVAPVMGPILGGVLTDNLSWPWIFYINIPVGLAAAWLTWDTMRGRESPTRKLPIDTVGLVLLVLWIGALQIMLDKGRELDWFNSTEIIVLAITAAIGLTVFLVWELNEAHPVVDLHLFARRNFTVGTLAVSLGYGVFFGNVVLVPLWLQQFMGYSATWAGLVTAPIGLLALLLSPVVGKILPTTDPRRIASFAFLVFAAVSFMRAGFNTSADAATIVIPQIIQGAAMATFFIPLVAVTLSGLEPHRIPSASGLSNFARITAGAFGASLTTTLWDHRASLHHARLAEHLDVFDPGTASMLQDLQASGLSGAQALALLERQMNVQAYMLAANDYFWLSGCLFLALLAVVWLARPATGGPALVAAAD